jgi:hypothetical protein
VTRSPAKLFPYLFAVFWLAALAASVYTFLQGCRLRAYLRRNGFRTWGQISPFESLKAFYFVTGTQGNEDPNISRLKKFTLWGIIAVAISLIALAAVSVYFFWHFRLLCG